MFKMKLVGMMVGMALVLPVPATAQNQSGGAQLEEVVITGIRGSLQRASDIKRRSDSLVDAIAAEDIGQFPDQNVAESLQRIPGVNINRVAGEGSALTVRGFGPEFNLVRVNDRTIATVAGERNFDFQVLPAALISSAEVVKTPTADLWDGSIGALVNLRTARPLANPGFHSTVSAEARYQDLGGDTGPRVAAVLSNTFADNSVGVLISASYEDREIRTDESRGGEGNLNAWSLFNGTTVDTGESVQFRYPARMGQSLTVDNRERLGLTGTLQFEPTDSSGVTIDAMYLDYNRTSLLQGVVAPLQFPNFADLVVNSNGTAESFTKTFGPLDIRYETDDNDTTTSGLGLNGFVELDNGLRLSGDLSWSRAEANNQDFLVAVGVRNNNPWNNPLSPGNLNNPGAGESNPAFADNVITWANGDVPTWSNSFDLTDPSIARGHVMITRGEDLEDDSFETRLDADWSIDQGVWSSVKFGVFHSDRDKSTLPYDSRGPFTAATPSFPGASATRDDNRCAWFDNSDGVVAPFEAINPGNPRPALCGRFFQAPAEFFTPITVGDLLSEENATFPNSFLLMDLARLCAWVRENTGNPDVCSVAPRSDLASGVGEKTFGAYIRVNLAGEWGARDWSLNAGLRYVDTETNAFGSSVELISISPQDPDGSTSSIIYMLTPEMRVDVDNQYSDVLPSVNFNIDLTDRTVLRAAAAKVITRPRLGLILPSQSFQGNFESAARITNNPSLQPYEAYQYDLSWEYYGESGTAFSIAAFYKDIDTFISETTTLESSGFMHPAFGEVILRTTAPNNRPGGTIAGVELATVYHFKNLPGWLGNLGIQANYTFVESKDDLANAGIASVPLATMADSGLEGFTPHSYNIIGFYEDERFNARVAWNWRDSFLDLRSGPEGIPAHFDAYGQLDAGFGYFIRDNVELTLDASNLLDNNTIRYADIRERVILNEYTGRRVFLGLRATF